MLKMRIFLEKAVKSPQRRILYSWNLSWPPAGGFAPRLLRCYSRLMIALSSEFLSLYVSLFYSFEIITEVSNSKLMLYFCFLRDFAPMFYFKLCSFCWWERKNIFLPAAGYSSCATGLYCAFDQKEKKKEKIGLVYPVPAWLIKGALNPTFLNLTLNKKFWLQKYFGPIS